MGKTYEDLKKESLSLEVSEDLLWSSLANQGKEIAEEIFVIMCMYMREAGEDVASFQKTSKKKFPYGIVTTTQNVGATFSLDTIPLPLQKILMAYISQ